MKLFDSYTRENADYRSPNEGKYSFLNRYAHPEYEQMRNLLEDWFQAYPASYQIGLGQNFKAKDDQQHEAALFELYLYTLLCRQNFAVDIEPPLSWTTKRIDFLVSPPDGLPFHMEVTVARDSDKSSIKQGRLGQLWEALDKLNSPNFWLKFEVEEESDEQLPPAQVRSFLAKWLQSLNIDEVWEAVEKEGHNAYPERTWKENGWEIVFFAIPKPPEDRHQSDETVLYRISAAQWAAAQNSLFNALDSKGRHYGKAFEYPFVIAVDILALDSIGCDLNEVFFGKRIALYNPETEQFTWTYSTLQPGRPDGEKGFWLGGRSGPRNKHVSAVLLVDQLGAVPELIASKTPILWHNPWAKRPFSPDLWLGPQMIPNMKIGQFERREGKSAQAILQLPPEWPKRNTARS